MKSPGRERGLPLLAAGAAAAGLFLSGCGTPDSHNTESQRGNKHASELAGKTSCQAFLRLSWGPALPTIGILSTEAVAHRLKVSDEQVAAGVVGPARCDDPINPEQADVKSGAIVTVSGFGKALTCEVVAFQTDQPVLEAAPNARDVLAVCPDPRI